MTEALFNAAAASNDTPDGPSVEVTDFKPKGRRGRPRKNIDKTFLQHALGVRNKTRIGAAIGCSLLGLRPSHNSSLTEEKENRDETIKVVITT